MNKLVSVVIATYNRSAELERAIRSVLGQTYANIELIVVDDNKDLNMSEAVKRVVESFHDSRLVLRKNEKNMGGALTRNEGIKQAKGDYIAFLDDDDEYTPDRIEKQLQLFQKLGDDVALLYCYCNSVDAAGETIRTYQYDYRGNCLFDAMKMCIAATSQWMCRKSALVDVGMFSDVPCKQDSTVIVKLLAAGYSIDRVPEVLSIYHEDNIQRISTPCRKNVSKRIAGEEALRELCRSHYDKIEVSQTKEVEYCFARALIGYYQMTGDKAKFAECLKKIISVHPVKRKSISTYKACVKGLIIKQ